jgi:putative intracellular protease/amidase
MKKILFIVTSADRLGAKKTGVWFEELSTPYYVLSSAGHVVEIASPKGGNTPFDPVSILPENTGESVKRFRSDKNAIQKIARTKILSSVNLGDYDVVFFPGGHGAMVDLPKDKFIADNLGRFFDEGKIVSAVCHGPAGLVTAKTSQGKSIVSGRAVTSFTDSEEIAVGGDKEVPFMLENKIRELGGNFKSAKDFVEFAVRDGNLITGQNPASSQKCAELVLQALHI